MSIYASHIPKFFNKKSVQHGFNFVVDFTSLTTFGGIGVDLKPREHLSEVTPYHVIDVDIPTYKFTRESIAVGVIQYSYPILAKEQPLDIGITLEDDVKGTVFRMIRKLENTVVNDGAHRAPKDMRLGDLRVSIVPLFGNDSKDSKYLAGVNEFRPCTYIFKNVFFLGSENLNLSYTNAETVKYKITFGADQMLCQY